MGKLIRLVDLKNNKNFNDYATDTILYIAYLGYINCLCQNHQNNFTEKEKNDFLKTYSEEFYKIIPSLRLFIYLSILEEIKEKNYSLQDAIQYLNKRTISLNAIEKLSNANNHKINSKNISKFNIANSFIGAICTSVVLSSTIISFAAFALGYSIIMPSVIAIFATISSISMIVGLGIASSKYAYSLYLSTHYSFLKDYYSDIETSKKLIDYNKKDNFISIKILPLDSNQMIIQGNTNVSRFLIFINLAKFIANLFTAVNIGLLLAGFTGILNVVLLTFTLRFITHFLSALYCLQDRDISFRDILSDVLIPMIKDVLFLTKEISTVINFTRDIVDFIGDSLDLDSGLKKDYNDIIDTEIINTLSDDIKRHGNTDFDVKDGCLKEIQDKEISTKLNEIKNYLNIEELDIKKIVYLYEF